MTKREEIRKSMLCSAGCRAQETRATACLLVCRRNICFLMRATGVSLCIRLKTPSNKFSPGQERPVVSVLNLLWSSPIDDAVAKVHLRAVA